MNLVETIGWFMTGFFTLLLAILFTLGSYGVWLLIQDNRRVNRLTRNL